ncbi:MAG: DNA mismatch repair protein MutS [Clostridia bacterium]|nr:DNA mismatch repair protein MutS [Clostridia bacterium]
MAEYTPMMRQYFEIKEKNKDSIVFYRLGDFYEMFFDDAIVASKELDLVLTGRDCGQTERAPMCGVPYHSAEGYISRLVQKGYKVSICEQVEDPATAKGLVKRDIVRKISKGTIIEDSMLEDGKNNFICSLYVNKNTAGICFCDMSTGEVSATECRGVSFINDIMNEISRFSPSEIVVSDEVYCSFLPVEELRQNYGMAITSVENKWFELKNTEDILKQHFDDVDTAGENNILSAVGALITFLHDTQKNSLEYINKINVYTSSNYMTLDANAKKNLEIIASLRSGDKKDSLLSVLDNTKTAMGSRLIKKWLVNPLLDVVAIRSRLNAVENLTDDIVSADRLADDLKDIYDIERIISRVSFGSANCRDLRALASVCIKLPSVKNNLMQLQSTMLKRIGAEIDILDDIFELIDSAIAENPPFSVREGGLIKAGFDERVDQLKELMSNSNQALADIERREKEATGIKTMKVGYNKVFGYYIEISKGQTAQAPEHYIRKQTLANCERYITEELKILEGEILSASDRCIALEYELFSGIRQIVADNAERFQRTAEALATADVLLSFAVVSRKHNYVMPEVFDDDVINIMDGRHPVVEALLKDSIFVANDAYLDNNENRMAIITGPNMAGKSTYMKQVALIVLMAQCGCFVPAKMARIGICDKIFTRVGASDDLAGGRSTFMVEMTEVADILKNATKRSLLILDEIGRGTSTYDGMSIARAVLEYSADKHLLGAKTMFATHYHELTALENTIQGVKNYNIVVKKRGDDIIFIKKIVPGGADESYGVEVAKLAGLPDKVITRAKAILEELENMKPREYVEKADESDVQQFSFTSSINNEIIKELQCITPEVLTPIEALNILNGLVRKAKA